MTISSSTNMLGQKIINKEQYILTECSGKTLKNLLSISSWANHSVILNTVLETFQSQPSMQKTHPSGLKEDSIPLVWPVIVTLRMTIGVSLSLEGT